ncbi:MAG TPA: carboxypeptidase regulatory-like domain-containing protein [Pseudomonadota bacterium]|nr:carboxypeptidase regulatory-like domain-containing protein [Pseudomonadota bacterium]
MRRIFSLLAPLVLLVPVSALAIGELDGRLAGVITDKVSGAPLPGARIRVSGSRLIGGPRTVATDDDGSYQIGALPPGSYDVELSYEGAKPLRRKIVIRQGESFPLSIAWSIEELSESTKVIVEERKLTHPDSTQTGTVLTSDQTARVATSRRYQDVAQQVAGVSGGSNPNIKGAMDSHNRYLVDGLDITDPVTNTFSANINFDSIESIEVMTGGAEAQYNSLGGTINLITAAGGNEWKISASQFFNHQSFSVGQQFGTQVYQGARPFLNLARPPQAGYQTTVMVGGPVIKNKLWVNLSFEYLRRESSQPLGPTLGIQSPSSLSDRFLARLKLTYAPTAKHRITLSLSADPAFFNNVDQDNLRLGIAEDYQRQGGVFSILQWDYFHSDSVNTNLQAGVQYSTVDVGPQGFFGSVDTSAYRGSGRFSSANDSYDPDRPQHYNADDGTYWYQGGGISYDKRITFQFDPSVSVRGKLLGKHEAKFGIQSRVTYHSFDASTPGGQSFSDEGGGPGESGLCLQQMGQTQGCNLLTFSPAFRNQQLGFSVGAFAQDRWQITQFLRVNPGIRVDYGRTTNSRGEEVSSLIGFGPRLGLLFDLTQDGKTLFTAYYGRSNEVLSLLAAAYADITPSSLTQKWDAEAKTFRDFRSSGGDGGYKLDPTGTPPHTDEVTLSLRREVLENSVASIDYTYKRVGNIWDSIEVNQIWDPTGTRVVDYVDGVPHQVFRYSRPDENWRVYQGVDFVFESRPRQEWDLFAAYTLSFLYGPGAEQFAQVSGSQTLSQFYNPRMYGFYDGFLPEDRRHNLKLRASYTFKGLLFGAFLNFQSGAPRTKRFYNQNEGDYTNRRSPSGTDPGQNPNDVTSIAEVRTPALLTTDLRIAYDLHSLLQKVHLSVSVDLFNLFNLDAPTEIEARDVPSYGQVRARQQPLRLQLGLQLQY